jgi:hypothetical protein
MFSPARVDRIPSGKNIVETVEHGTSCPTKVVETVEHRHLVSYKKCENRGTRHIVSYKKCENRGTFNIKHENTGPIALVIPFLSSSYAVYGVEL